MRLQKAIVLSLVGLQRCCFYLSNNACYSSRIKYNSKRNYLFVNGTYDDIDIFTRDLWCNGKSLTVINAFATNKGTFSIVRVDLNETWYIDCYLFVIVTFRKIRSDMNFLSAKTYCRWSNVIFLMRTPYGQTVVLSRPFPSFYTMEKVILLNDYNIRCNHQVQTPSISINTFGMGGILSIEEESWLSRELQV